MTPDVVVIGAGIVGAVAGLEPSMPDAFITKFTRVRTKHRDENLLGGTECEFLR